MTFLRKNSNKGFSSPPKQSAGILDDHAVRKALHTKEFAGNCKFVHGGMVFGEICATNVDSE